MKQKKLPKYTKLVKVVFATLMIIIIMYDQVPTTAVITKEAADTAKNIYYNDAEFVSKIEEFEEDQAMVLVLPLSYGVNGSINLTSTGHQSSYEEYKMYFHSKTSKWSPDAVTGEKTDLWIENLDKQPLSNILKIASVMNFTGIALYYSPYPLEELDLVRQSIEQELGLPVITNANNNWCYYTLDGYSETLKMQYTEEELKILKEICENDISGVNGNIVKNLYYNNEIHLNGDITIEPGNVQYGPYYNLNEGWYDIVVEGSNLSDVDFDCNSKGENIDIIEVTEQSDNYIKYKIFLNTKRDAVEFRVFNNTEHNSLINKVYYYKDYGQNNDLIYNKFFKIE